MAAQTATDCASDATFGVANLRVMVEFWVAEFHVWFNRGEVPCNVCIGCAGLHQARQATLILSGPRTPNLEILARKDPKPWKDPPRLMIYLAVCFSKIVLLVNTRHYRMSCELGYLLDCRRFPPLWSSMQL